MDEDVDQIVMHNLHTQSDKSTQQATEDRTQPHRHVQWKDQTTEYSSSEGSQSDCDDDEDDDDETCVSRPTTITFSHSHMNPQSSQVIIVTCVRMNTGDTMFNSRSPCWIASIFDMQIDTVREVLGGKLEPVRIFYPSPNIHNYTFCTLWFMH